MTIEAFAVGGRSATGISEIASSDLSNCLKSKRRNDTPIERLLRFWHVWDIAT
jgi:hypothetical protein